MIVKIITIINEGVWFIFYFRIRGDSLMMAIQKLTFKTIYDGF